MDSNKITATDYAVYIEGLPKTAGRKEIGQFFRLQQHPEEHDTQRAVFDDCRLCVHFLRKPGNILWERKLEEQERWTQQITNSSFFVFIPSDRPPPPCLLLSAFLCGVPIMTPCVFASLDRLAICTSWNRRIGRGGDRMRSRNPSSMWKTPRTSGTWARSDTAE